MRIPKINILVMNEPEPICTRTPHTKLHKDPYIKGLSVFRTKEVSYYLISWLLHRGIESNN